MAGVPLPAIIDAAGLPNTAALALVEQMAKDGRSQGTIASTFNIPVKRFKYLLDKNKGENELRLAWERGKSAHEQWIIDSMLKRIKSGAKDKGSIIALIYYTKARLGWEEKNSGHGMQQTNVQVIMPGSMSREEYMRRLQGEPPLIEGKVIKEGDNAAE